MHRNEYRDTSLLLEIFTPEFGRVGLIAKGVRHKKSKLSGILQLFQPLLVSWVGTGELGTLTAAESQQNITAFLPQNVSAGFYLNELLVRLLPRHDAHVELFSCYDVTVRGLRSAASLYESAQDAHILLRRFELQLLESLGYALELYHEARSGDLINKKKNYRYVIGEGPIEIDTIPGDTNNSNQSRDGARLSGETFLALQRINLQKETALGNSQNTVFTPQVKAQSKQLLRSVLDYYLGGKPLMSRSLFQQKPRSSCHD